MKEFWEILLRLKTLELDRDFWSVIVMVVVLVIMCVGVVLVLKWNKKQEIKSFKPVKIKKSEKENQKESN